MTDNAASKPEKGTVPKGFQPMSLGNKQLEVPEKPGYHRRWFRSEPGRIARAQRAGYQFVSPEDVDLNNFDLGGDAKVSGNTDMGTRVSIISGERADSTGQPGRMYLMECPTELYELSRKNIDEINNDIATAIRDGKVEKAGEDNSHKYVKKSGVADLFTPKR